MVAVGLPARLDAAAVVHDVNERVPLRGSGKLLPLIEVRTAGGPSGDRSGPGGLLHRLLGQRGELLRGSGVAGGADGGEGPTGA